MTKTASAIVANRGTLAVRPGASRKLLARKAGEIAAAADPADGAALEESFPVCDDPDHAGQAAGDTAAPIDGSAPITTAPLDIESIGEAAPASGSEPQRASPEGEPPAPVAQASPAPAWSSEDESALQAMLARRKAAGFQRRGKDVSGQLIRAGDIAPNPGTVVATIVAIVTQHGPMTRGRLIDLMAVAAFASAKAKPSDRAWCNGYVAGAVRDGFLALADGSAAGAIGAGEVSLGDDAPNAGEASPASAETAA